MEFTFKVQKVFIDVEGKYPQTITVLADNYELAKDKAENVLKTFEGNPFKMMLLIESVKEF